MKEIRNYEVFSIPMLDGCVQIRLPRPMTQVEFARVCSWLSLMHGALVEEEKAPEPQPRPKNEEGGEA